MRLSTRLARVSPSATLAAKVAAEELRARGVQVIDFGPGEPDGATPAPIVAAARAALERGETHYSDPAGLPALRAALAARVAARTGRSAAPAEVVVNEEPCTDDRPRPQAAVIRKDEAERVDQMRRRAQQHLALRQRLMNQPEVVVLEIAKAAVDELGRGR